MLCSDQIRELIFSCYTILTRSAFLKWASFWCWMPEQTRGFFCMFTRCRLLLWEPQLATYTEENEHIKSTNIWEMDKVSPEISMTTHTNTHSRSWTEASGVSLAHLTSSAPSFPLLSYHFSTAVILFHNFPSVGLVWLLFLLLFPPRSDRLSSKKMPCYWIWKVRATLRPCYLLCLEH